MKKTLKVTLLVVPVIALVSVFNATAMAANLKPNKIVMRANQVEKEVIEPEPVVSLDMQISRSTSLIDHRDGTRSDGMDYLVAPTMKLSYGTIKAKIIYSQNLRDDTGHTYDGTIAASDWGDVAISFSKTPYKWLRSYPYMTTLTPYITAVVPASQNSLKRDQLKGSGSLGLSFGITPDGVAPVRDGAWSLAIATTFGRNVHDYDTDINGNVLNRYSSNQTLNLGYGYKDFSVSLEFINKVRWTYQNNTKGAFEHSEEVGYTINPHFSVALGHTNRGSALKANGLDSNLEVINENDSTVYGSLGLSF